MRILSVLPASDLGQILGGVDQKAAAVKKNTISAKGYAGWNEFPILYQKFWEDTLPQLIAEKIDFNDTTL